MFIGGIQKLSLLDYPDRVCCTIFTVGCNYRCPFCHNAPLIQGVPPSPLVSKEEVLAFLKKRRGLLDGVCITGGEPLLQGGLEDLIDEIKALGFLVKLDTNGSNPTRLRRLIDAKAVDFVAMDIKNMPGKYGTTIGVEDYDLSPVRESVALLLSNRVPYEFRTTVVRELHEPDDLLSIARWIQGAERYCLQSYVHSNEVLGKNLSAYAADEMEDMLRRVRLLLPFAALRGQ